MGSSWTRDGTHVPCIGSQVLNHWTTGEVPGFVLVSGLFLVVMDVVKVLMLKHLLQSILCSAFLGILSSWLLTLKLAFQFVTSSHSLT